MDFESTQEQQDLTELAANILADRATERRLAEIDGTQERFDRQLWRILATAGVLSAGLPGELGGGAGVLEECSVAIELGRAVAPVPYVSSMMAAAGALARFGTAEQRQRWAIPATAGELVPTVALLEALGDDPGRPTAAAHPVEGGWTLSGTKVLVPAGTVAELILVPAATPDGVVVFAVRPDDPNVRITPQTIVDGDTEPTLECDGTTLSAARVLGNPGDGDRITAWLRHRATIGVCAHQLGVCERALEMTAEYARQRTQFGKAIGSFQAVAQRLADAYIDVEAIRLTLWQAAWLMVEDRAVDTALATAKFWAADGGHRVAHTAVHVHGGVGLDLGAAPHRYFVAAKRNEFTLGASTAQLRHIGTALATEPA